jgi:hypothetical protein
VILAPVGNSFPRLRLSAQCNTDRLGICGQTPRPLPVICEESNIIRPFRSTAINPNSELEVLIVMGQGLLLMLDDASK